MPAQSLQTDSVDVSDRRARTLFIRGLTQSYLEDYNEAVSLFEKALDVAPQQPAILSALSEAEAGRNNLTSAIYYARQARDHAPATPYYHLELARLLQQAQRPEDAAEAYRKLLARFPSHKDGRIALARLLKKLERPHRALETYETVVDSSRRVPPEVFPEMLDLYRTVDDQDGLERTLKRLIHLRRDVQLYRRMLGRLYTQQDRYQDAIPLFETLLQENPNDPRLLSRLKMLYTETGQPQKAKKVGSHVPKKASSPEQLLARARSLFNSADSLDDSTSQRIRRLSHRALELSPADPQALDLLGKIHYEQGDYAEAASFFQRAIDENPRAPDRWHLAASAHLRADSVRQAAALAEEGLLLFPGRYDLLQVEAFARLRLGEYEGARSRFREALSKLDSSSVSPRERASLQVGLGRALYAQGHFQRADSTFAAALQGDPDHWTALTYRARSLVQQEKNLDRALQLARRAVEINASVPITHGTLGWVHVARGNYTSAISALEKAIATGQAPAWVYEHLGDAHHALGHETLAKKYWKKALERAPDRDSLEQKLHSTSQS